ncbi:MAG: hypothetical protein Aureis2KO_33150 [Aureisphaera sp.]
MNEFSEKYQSLSDYEILRILEEKEKYQLMALEAAREELKQRNLSEDKIALMQEDIRKAAFRKEEQEAIHKEEMRMHREKFFKLLSALNPFQVGIQTPEKIIRFLTLIFGAASIYSFYSQFWTFRYLFQSEDARWDLSIILSLIILFLLPIAVYLFYRRKKIGWILFSFYLGYNTISSFLMLIYAIRTRDMYFEVFESLIPSLPVALASVAFYAGALLALCKREILNIFKVSTNTIVWTVVLVMILFSIHIYYFYFY